MGGRGRRCGVGGLGKEERFARRGEKARAQSGLGVLLQQPLRARGQVLLVLGFRGDAGKTNVVAEFLDEPALISLEIIEDSLHRRFVARPAQRSKVTAASSGARHGPRIGAANKQTASRS